MKIIVFVIILVLTNSCNILTQKENTKDVEFTKSIDRGSVIYADFCVTCHLPSGAGVIKVFPPLAKSNFLLENREARRESHEQHMVRLKKEEDMKNQQKMSTHGSDRQVGGNHYKDCVIQPTEYIVKNKLDFLEGNVVKYITRHKTKGQEEDIRKVIHYAELILEYTYGK